MYMCVFLMTLKMRSSPVKIGRRRRRMVVVKKGGRGGGIIDSFKHYLIWMEVLLLKVRYLNDHKCS